MRNQTSAPNTGEGRQIIWGLPLIHPTYDHINSRKIAAYSKRENKAAINCVSAKLLFFIPETYHQQRILLHQAEVNQETSSVRPPKPQTLRGRREQISPRIRQTLRPTPEARSTDNQTLRLILSSYHLLGPKPKSLHRLHHNQPNQISLCREVSSYREVSHRDYLSQHTVLYSLQIQETSSVQPPTPQTLRGKRKQISPRIRQTLQPTPTARSSGNQTLR